MTMTKYLCTSVTAAVVWLTITGSMIAAEQGNIENKNSPNQSAAAPASGEQIKWQVISAGGNRGSSTSYVLSGTVGQTAVGSGTSTSYKLNQGFWQNFAASNCNCGDANGDGTINISDAVFLIQYIFAHGTAPSPICLGDANGDNTVNISDAVYLIQQ